MAMKLPPSPVHIVRFRGQRVHVKRDDVYHLAGNKVGDSVRGLRFVCCDMVFVEHVVCVVDAVDAEALLVSDAARRFLQRYKTIRHDRCVCVCVSATCGFSVACVTVLVE